MTYVVLFIPTLSNEIRGISFQILTYEKLQKYEIPKILYKTCQRNYFAPVVCISEKRRSLFAITHANVSLLESNQVHLASP